MAAMPPTGTDARGVGAMPRNQLSDSFGGVTAGDSVGGVTDRVFVTAPPEYRFQVETEPGSFLDCGRNWQSGIADGDGRHQALISCGVTLTETLVIPASATSARLTVHY